MYKAVNDLEIYPWMLKPQIISHNNIYNEHKLDMGILQIGLDQEISTS